MIDIANRRASSRRYVRAPATIQLEFGTIECSTINIHDHGLKLLLPEQVELPGEFRVSVPDQRVRSRRARMVWRNGLELGVRFI